MAEQPGLALRPAITGSALLAALLVATAAGGARAQGCAEPVAHLVSLAGDVRVNGAAPAGDPPYIPVCPGDTVEIGQDSRAGAYLLGADTPLQLEEETLARFQPPAEPGSGLVDLARGAVYFLSEVRRTLTIRTPYVTAGVKGTEVYLRADRPGAGGGEAGGAELIVLEGRVALTPGSIGDDFPALQVTTGERVELGRDGPPRSSVLPGGPGFDALRRVTVEQISWTLFYPDVLVADEAAEDVRLGEAGRLLAAGQAAEAEQSLRAIPDGGRAAALRDALRAAVLIGRRDAAGAERLATAAVAAAPGAASPEIARSYVQQAKGDIEGAHAAAAAAANAAPRSTLAQARLAEVELMRGRPRAARTAVRRARAAGATTALIEIVGGYVELAAFQGAAAEAAFRRALAGESRNPLALLGFGLALIRQGRLEAGTMQIQNAVAHDPASGILRAYLGKALLDQWRGAAAEKQLAIAKALAPEDPTPWRYDAMALELGNRPVAALRALEEALARNDNRATFRSSLLLDEDRAAGSVRLGYLYEWLGVRRLALPQAARALAEDPASTAGHRLLADTYAGLPRHEVARGSENLQTLLFAPVGTVPVRPSEAFTDLKLPGDVFGERVGFSEYGGLFERDGARGTVSALVGNHGTWGEEAVATARQAGTAVSAGQFVYRSDGFRENFDNEQRVLQVRGEQALGGEAASVFLEHRRRSGEEGDLVLNFDQPGDSEDEREVDDHLTRLGLRWRLEPHTTLIMTGDSGKRRDDLRDADPAGDTRSRFEDEGTVGQAQLIHDRGLFNLILGGSAGRIESRNVTDLTLDDGLADAFSVQDDTDFHAFYGYVGLTPAPRLQATLGLGWSSASGGDQGTDRSELEPKFAASLELAPGWRLRGGYAETVKRRLVLDETLEPTTLAGFNQFFDDPNGTRASQWSLGLDGRLGRDLFVGADLTRRSLEEPGIIFDEGTGDFLPVENRLNEERFGLYAYRLLGERFAFGAGLYIDRFQDNNTSGIVLSNAPNELRSRYVPITLRWFSPGGLFAGLRATWLQQDIEQLSEDGRFEDDEEDSIIMDVELGYQFRQDSARLVVEARNLFDKDFRYQDDNFRTSRTQLSPYLPERTIIARGIVRF